MNLQWISDLEDKLALRRTTVLFTTLWMTWDAFHWAATYVATVKTGDGLAAAALVGAVTGPITYLQKSVFDSYITAKDNG